MPVAGTGLGCLVNSFRSTVDGAGTPGAERFTSTGEAAVGDAGQVLDTARTVVVVDWPTKDVPETLARAGYTVLVKGGPEPDVVPRRTGEAPAAADLVYSYRPVGELPGIVAMAREFGAGAVWLQSGLASDGTKTPQGCWMDQATSREARAIVESAGLTYVEAPYIADAVRSRGARE
jgi:predicted CoA-binding protein